MQHDEFIGQVQARARLGSRGDAERVTRAVLEAIGERIPDGLTGNLASQLPREIGEHLRRTERPDRDGTGEHFDRNGFADRVSEKSGYDGPGAIFVARVVCEVLREATTGGVMAKVRDSLPPDLRPVVMAGSSGRMRD
ncbi:DUF2267 domain-containing protein [Rhizomonospora bruguierae]|uniref:DUF2267 domain-containing protein n=1 Tax=Rhizomonospora bruguierae TaxID=1581705 RepID=UPI001BCF6723|nr:DUF2267 domain-containing protein [Micromonospora sp. NBRC 107566]